LVLFVIVVMCYFLSVVVGIGCCIIVVSSWCSIFVFLLYSLAPSLFPCLYLDFVNYCCCCYYFMFIVVVNCYFDFTVSYYCFAYWTSFIDTFASYCYCLVAFQSPYQMDFSHPTYYFQTSCQKDFIIIVIINFNFNFNFNFNYCLN